MKKALSVSALALVTLTGAIAGIPLAHADQKAECDAARARLKWLPGLWQSGGTCDLGDDNSSVRPDPWGAGLTHFRGVKSEFMNYFAADTAGSVGADLAAIKDKASEYIGKHADKSDNNAKLQAAIDKIDALNAAIDAMRPDGATNPGRINAIDKALGALQDTCADDAQRPTLSCPGQGSGALEELDKTLQASSDADLSDLKDKVHALVGDGTRLGDAAAVVDRLRCIQDCRNWDGQLARDRSTSASTACSGNTDGGKDPFAGFVGPLTVAQLKTLCTAVPGDARCHIEAGANAAGTSDSTKPKEVASNDGGAASGDGGKAHSAKVCAHADDVLDAGADCVPAKAQD